MEHGSVTDAVEESIDRGRIAHVADDGLDLRADDVEERGGIRIADEASERR